MSVCALVLGRKRLSCRARRNIRLRRSEPDPSQAQDDGSDDLTTICEVTAVANAHRCEASPTKGATGKLESLPAPPEGENGAKPQATAGAIGGGGRDAGVRRTPLAEASPTKCAGREGARTLSNEGGLPFREFVCSCVGLTRPASGPPKRGGRVKWFHQGRRRRGRHRANSGRRRFGPGGRSRASRSGNG